MPMMSIAEDTVYREMLSVALEQLHAALHEKSVAEARIEALKEELRRYVAMMVTDADTP